jgi:hypothetical protein
VVLSRSSVVGGPDVGQLVGVLEIAVKMWPGFGVVPDLRVVKRDFSQESAPRELAQRVVDRAKGWGEVDRACLVVECLRSEMPVA